MVGGAITDPSATTELLVRLSSQAAPQRMSLCHRYTAFAWT
jgi:hypothetical protein